MVVVSMEPILEHLAVQILPQQIHGADSATASTAWAAAGLYFPAGSAIYYTTSHYITLHHTQLDCTSQIVMCGS